MIYLRRDPARRQRRLRLSLQPIKDKNLHGRAEKARRLLRKIMWVVW
jgi:hypothetical protein